MSGFDEVCRGCEFVEVVYELNSGDVDEYCGRDKDEHPKCPRADRWREYFKRTKENAR